jgi:hypothetical protein
MALVAGSLLVQVVLVGISAGIYVTLEKVVAIQMQGTKAP